MVDHEISSAAAEILDLSVVDILTLHGERFCLFPGKGKNIPVLGVIAVRPVDELGEDPDVVLITVRARANTDVEVGLVDEPVSPLGIAQEGPRCVRVFPVAPCTPEGLWRGNDRFGSQGPTGAAWGSSRKAFAWVSAFVRVSRDVSRISSVL
jgi:hypothetical protein